MLARLYGRSWTKGKRRSLRCVRRTGRARTHKKVTKKKTFAAVSRTRYRTYDCRISWRARTRRYHARSTVVRRGLRITTRVRVQTIRP